MRIMQFILVQIRKALQHCTKEYREYRAAVKIQKAEAIDRFPFTDMEICLARKDRECWRPILFCRIIPEGHEDQPFQSYENYYSELAYYDPEMVDSFDDIEDTWTLSRLKTAGYIDE